MTRKSDLEPRERAMEPSRWVKAILVLVGDLAIVKPRGVLATEPPRDVAWREDNILEVVPFWMSSLLSVMNIAF